MIGPFERRYSGRAAVLIRYVPGEESYVWQVSVDGVPVNACAIGAVPSMPEAARTGPEAYDESARAALSFTIWELGEDPEQEGMRSGMSAEDFESVLEHDEDYNIIVRRGRPPRGATRSR